MISVLVVLVLAGVALWAVGQLPTDAVILRLVRVVVVVFVVLYLLGAFGLLPRGCMVPRW
jgi:type IV secretory pathway TrbL component